MLAGTSRQIPLGPPTQGLRFELYPLYDNRGRWFDAQNRRFIQLDPMGYSAGDTNLYRYQFNTPTKWTDPSGYAVPEWFEEMDEWVGRHTYAPEIIDWLARKSVDSNGEYRGVGQPGLAESFTPFWGSGRAALDDAQNGRWGWMVFNSIMFGIDALLVPSLIRGGVQLLKAGIKPGVMRTIVTRGAANLTGRNIRHTAHLVRAAEAKVAHIAYEAIGKIGRQNVMHFFGDALASRQQVWLRKFVMQFDLPLLNYSRATIPYLATN